MVIEFNDGRASVVSTGRRPLTPQKIGKRWFLVFPVQGQKQLRSEAVKRIRRVRPGRTV